MYKIYSICYRDQKHTLKEPPPIQRLAFKVRKGGGGRPFPIQRLVLRDARGVSAPEPIQRCPPPRFKVSLLRGARGAPVRHRFKVSLSRNKGLLSSDLRGRSSPIQKLFFQGTLAGTPHLPPIQRLVFKRRRGVALSVSLLKPMFSKL